jgi:Na+-translocating ferredoxin:NAD+ oxidoreductase RnfC subunit
MDWSVQPPNSQYFEDNQKEYLEKQKKKDEIESMKNEVNERTLRYSKEIDTFNKILDNK